MFNQSKAGRCKWYQEYLQVLTSIYPQLLNTTNFIIEPKVCFWTQLRRQSPISRRRKSIFLIKLHFYFLRILREIKGSLFKDYKHNLLHLILANILTHLLKILQELFHIHSQPFLIDMQFVIYLERKLYEETIFSFIIWY